MAPSYSERQAQYAAWRDRLRRTDDVIDLDEKPSGDRWNADALFGDGGTIDLDAVVELDGETIAGATDQIR